MEEQIRINKLGWPLHIFESLGTGSIFLDSVLLKSKQVTYNRSN